MWGWAIGIGAIGNNALRRRSAAREDFLELYRPHVEKTIYLLDEPTVGLHYEDVRKLIEILDRLVVRGNTVVVIEHNMDVIKSADYIVDFGPEGETEGKVVAKPPEEVANAKGSHTANYLKKVLRKNNKRTSQGPLMKMAILPESTHA